MDQAPGLLHRLSGALVGRARGTDWWMVAVEIAIVVLGILIAFQVDRWGDRIAQRQEEAALLLRVEAEARQSLRALDLVIADHRSSADNLRRLAEAGDDLVRGARFNDAARDGCNLLRLPAVRRPASAALAQAAGPRIALIGDAALRQSLGAWASAREFGDAQLPYFRDLFLRYHADIEPHMRWSFADPGSDPRCAVDTAAIAADASAVALLPKIARDQLRMADYRADEREALVRTADRAACLRAGRCR